MFSRDWVKSLRKKLTEFLYQHLPSLETALLYKMWDAYQQKQQRTHSANQIEPTARDNTDVLEKLTEEITSLRLQKEEVTAKLVESQAKWTSFAKDILSISKELTKAFQAIQNGKQIPDDFFENSARTIEKYEKFLNESQSLFQSPDKNFQIPKI